MKQMLAFAEKRRNAAKAAYTTARIAHDDMATLLRGDLRPRAGDLVLARVLELGQHKRIERPDGRRVRLFPGDEILVCYGNRYAPDQFESVVPDDLGTCHLVAAGGVASKMLTRHDRMHEPTVIEPIGLVGDREGRVINLSRYALAESRPSASRPYTIAVIGTSMNAGKTTTAANLIRGLTASGLSVGAAKITGTGAGGDVWFMTDAGADVVLDFTHAGLPSTYLSSQSEIETIHRTLTNHLASRGVDVIVLEVADGLYQEETSRLVRSQCFRDSVDTLMFAAGDAMGAAAGTRWLHEQRWDVLAVSGALTASPLATREAKAATNLPVMTADQLVFCNWRELIPTQKRTQKAAARISMVDSLRNWTAPVPALQASAG